MFRHDLRHTGYKTEDLAIPHDLFDFTKFRGLNSSASLAEPSHTNWNRTYGGPDYDYGRCVVQTSDGGYAIAGSTRSFATVGDLADFWLVKTDSNGEVQWSRAYGGPDSDSASCVVQTSDGGYAIAGTTEWLSFGVMESDFWLVKTDSEGNVQWDRTYGGPDMDSAWCVVQTSDGGYAIEGITYSFGAGGGDCWLVKTDSDGNMEWNRTYGDSDYNGADSVVQTSDGGYAIAGSARPFGAGYDYDSWLVKTDSEGNIQWNRTYGGPDYDYAKCVVQARDGGYALAGGTGSFGAGEYDFWLVKTDSEGNIQWNRTYGGPDMDEAHCVVQTTDGGYILAGRKKFFDDLDCWLVKTDSTGNMEWSRAYGGRSLDHASCVVQTSDGGYAIAGWTFSFGVGQTDFWLIKIVHLTFPLKVHVTGSRLQPLPNSRVDLVWGNDTLFGTKSTDVLGRAYFEVPLGSFKVWVVYKGLYQTQTMSINEPKEISISLDVFLEVFGMPLTKMQTILLISSVVVATTAVTYAAIKRRKYQ